jgi:hypothetical protein
VRIVCANTQAAAIAGARSTFGIRHTSGAGAAIHEARTALGLAWRYMDAFESEAAALYAAPMELEEMHAFATHLVKADDTTASATASSRPTASSSCGRRARPSPRSRAPSGRPTTPSPSTSTTSRPCAELAPAAPPPRPARCAPSPPAAASKP